MSLVTDFVWEFITLFSEMAPFLLLGFLLAGLGGNLWRSASDL